MGSGPAYVFLLIEALTRAGIDFTLVWYGGNLLDANTLGGLDFTMRVWIDPGNHTRHYVAEAT